MPDPTTLPPLPDTTLQSLTPPNYKPLNQADVSAVTNPPPPVFKASNTDIQVVAGTQQAVVPAPPPAFGDNPPQAQVGATVDDSGFPARVQAVGGKDPSAFIVHHTGGRLSLDGLTSTLKQRGLGVEYFMDRGDANRGPKIYQVGNSGAANILPGWGAGQGLNNSNIVGMEISANDDKDVTDAQKQLFAQFIQARYPTTQLFGHGEVNPGHKEADEGMSAKNTALALRRGAPNQPTTSSSGTAITPGQPSSTTDVNKLPMPAPGSIPPGVTASQVTATTSLADTFKQLNAGGLNATHYGYKGDPYLDPESAKRNGAYVPEGTLIPGYDVAMNAAAAAKVGNPKPGSEFQYAGRTWRYGDAVPEKYSDARFDIFDPNKEFGPDANAPQFTSQGNQEASQKPAAFGMRVAAPEDVQRYDQFINNGGNPDNIPVYDRLAVAIAKDPNFLSKPENFEEFYGLVYKPLQAQSMGEQFNKAMMNIVPSTWQTIQNIGAAAGNAVAGVYDQAKIAYQSVTGTSSDFGPAGDNTTVAQTKQDLAQRQASVAAGIGQGVSDAYNFVSGTLNGLLSLPKPIMDAVISDPAARDQTDRVYAQNLQMVVASQQRVSGLAKATQQLSAHAYAQIGFHDQAERIAQATPDPNVVAGTAMLANPLNVLPIAEGLEAVNAFKPVFFERALNLGEEVAGATAKKAALDSTQIVPENVTQFANTPGYSEAQNARMQFQPQQAAAAQAVTQTQNDLATQLTRLGKTSADPGTAMGVLSNVIQTGGKMISGVGETAQLLKDVPEQFGRWASGGNPLVG